jgi:ABC-type spermidine/putrescine transport system permease subunit I
MSVVAAVLVVVGAVAVYAVYQLVKSKKAVTVANVVAQASTDASAAKVKLVADADAKKL